MKVALVGAELEENLALRYMASVLECRGHQTEIIPFQSRNDIQNVVNQVSEFSPQITGFSMVFTARAREFCDLAQSLREEGCRSHIIAGGHFASFNCKRLLQDFPAFDSVALGEGENLMCALADNLDNTSLIPGLCYRQSDGSIQINPPAKNQDNIDSLSFPKRMTFHEYFNKPIASILSSRGCWRNCAFCSINAWYKRVGGKKFRIRSVQNIIAEMKELYFQRGVRIFNFQDDNFFLPDPAKALNRFEELKSGLQRESIEGIAIAIKARPDSITYDSIKVLDKLGLFRVFLGVENLSENGLRNLNRKCTPEQILKALRILNDFDVHIAFNLLIFEPDTVLDDILKNLRFIERHIENPFNFCRAEAYAGTGLEAKLRAEGRLQGNYFGFDYRIKDPYSEAFHQIANYSFFDRNFSDFGLHYFNMQVDFYFHLLRRFHPEVLTRTLRAAVRSFIKQTNLDTYKCLCQIFDFVSDADPNDHFKIRSFARDMRQQVDERSRELQDQGEHVLDWLTNAHGQHCRIDDRSPSMLPRTQPSLLSDHIIPCRRLESIKEWNYGELMRERMDEPDIFGITSIPIPYILFRRQLDQQRSERR